MAKSKVKDTISEFHRITVYGMQKTPNHEFLKSSGLGDCLFIFVVAVERLTSL